MRVSLAILVSVLIPVAGYGQHCPVNLTRVPADIPVPNAQANASTFQQFSWDSFLGLNAAEVGGPPANVPAQDPLWREWSSTVDMLSCQGSPRAAGCDCPEGDCTRSGSRFYPTACRAIPGFDDHRVLQQRGRFDNSFLEADVAGLTNSPVIDRFGEFLRYEILVSPVTYDNVVEAGLWDQDTLDANSEDLVFSCGLPEYSGGDPGDPAMGDIVLKVAWMDVAGEAGAALNLNHYYTESLLIYTPAYRASDGVERCELKNMAMVGMHIAHKTLRQPNWIWSTFEHRDTAPNCTELVPGPGIIDTNMSCPDSVSREFDLNGTRCNGDDPACAACNVTPASNDPSVICRNPTTPDLEGWCLDQPPAAVEGISRLCRHVAVEPPIIDVVPAPIPNPLPDHYPQAAAWNQACANELVLNDHDPWSHYMLISGQWLNADALPPEPPEGLSCETVADEVFFGIVDFAAIEPKVPTNGGDMRPFLGNITMESYGKSNCVGCHARGQIETSGGDSYNSDFMFFPSIQVARQESNFMTYMALDPVSACRAPEDPAVFTFDFSGAVANARVVEQSVELLLGIEISQSLPVPVVTASDAITHGQPWLHAGEPIALAPDDGCEPGACQVDLTYPPSFGKRWAQYHSVPNLVINPDESAFAAHLTVAFEGLRCVDVNPLDLRLWLGDNSQFVYANQVDGDYLDLTLYLLPLPPPPEAKLPAIPATNRLALLILILAVAAVGLRQAQRF